MFLNTHEPKVLKKSFYEAKDLLLAFDIPWNTFDKSLKL